MTPLAAASRHPRRRRLAATQLLPLLLLLLLLPLLAGRPAAAQPRAMPSKAPRTCGAAGQGCCPECQPDIPLTACDQWSCADGAQCYMFGAESGLPPDGGEGFPMVCLNTPKSCGREGGPCCFNADPTSEDRCGPGLTCIAEGVIPYAGFAMFKLLKLNNSATADAAVMGTCRKLTKSDCGKLWRPCGAAAKKLGCDGGKLKCKDAAAAFCASPGDTRLGGPRCLPLPPDCGKLGGACCPGNMGGYARERSTTEKDAPPVPTCTDGRSMCVWQADDYAAHGTAQFPHPAGEEPAAPYPWDGLFERGYGRSRCVQLPKSCGQPGEPCCPSMIDRRLSGMVHNKVFEHQPCDYRAGGKAGVYCNGTWQGGLLASNGTLGVCTVNAADCGQPGKRCCLNDVPEVGGAVGTCQRAGADPYYCSAAKGSLCERCPAKPTMDEQRANCFAFGQIAVGPAAGPAAAVAGGGGNGGAAAPGGGRRAPQPRRRQR